MKTPLALTLPALCLACGEIRACQTPANPVPNVTAPTRTTLPEETPSPLKKSDAHPAKSQSLETMRFDEFAPALEKTLRGFAGAATVDAMLPFVRERKTVEPLIRAYYTDANPWRPPVFRKMFQPDAPFTVDGNYLVTQLEGPDFAELPVSLEWDGASFLVDWESFVGYGEMSWEELLKKRPVDPVLMRVVIEKSDRTAYFNEDFTDPQKHHCWLLRNLSSELFLSGYTVPNSPGDLKIRQHLKPVAGETLQRTLAIVRIRFRKEGKSVRQVEISEMLENGWVRKHSGAPHNPAKPDQPAASKQP